MLSLVLLEPSLGDDDEWFLPFSKEVIWGLLAKMILFVSFIQASALLLLQSVTNKRLLSY